MFLCLKCKKPMNLPTCSCGYTVKRQNLIWQLSDMPDIVIDGDGDKYIRYEYIGENYSGSRKYLIEENASLFAKEASQITGDGILLDLACGDGCLTIPCAANGTEIIAGDISNHMLSILQEKAVHNKISLEKVTLCRMNALDIPLEDESVSTVVANSMLHLISTPQKVINEIYRVLKKGGIFLCRDDRPGKAADNSTENEKYNQIVNKLYSQYWTTLIRHNVHPTKYSWKFNRDEFCDSLFARKTEKVIRRGNPFETSIKDGFLPRFCNRGFSDQVKVPLELHQKVIESLLSDFRESYEGDFTEVCFKGTEDDLVITAYTKQ